MNFLNENLNGALCCVGEKRLVVVGKGFLRKGTEGWDDIYPNDFVLFCLFNSCDSFFM